MRNRGFFKGSHASGAAGLLTLSVLVLAIPIASAAEEPKPAGPEKRTAVGKCTTVAGSLLRREAPGKPWQAVGEKEEVYSGDLLLAVPFAGIELKSGVRLLLLADMEGRSPFPIIESAVVLHENAEVDLDFTLDRGRAIVTNHKDEGSVKVKARFGKEVWDMNLAVPKTRVGMEMYGRWPKGSHFSSNPKPADGPTLDLVLMVLTGRIHLDVGCHEFSMRGPPVGPSFIQWDSATGCDENPQRLPKVPSWAGTEDLTGSPEPGKKPELLKKLIRVNRFRKLVKEKSVDAAISEFLNSDDPDRRRVAVFALGAIDDLSGLGSAIKHAKHIDVWENGVLALRHWLGRCPGQDQKFYNFLVKEHGYTPAHASIALQLTRSFSDHDVATPECYELLTEYLKHEKAAVRGLAYWHLYRLVPAGRHIAFNPNGPADERAKGYQEWKKLIPDGKMPPMHIAEDK